MTVKTVRVSLWLPGYGDLSSSVLEDRSTKLPVDGAK